MPSQTALELLLGRARLAPYVLAASGDLTRATDLYLWATQRSGALHGQISFVEIAVRNAMDVQLASWNDAAGLGRDWSADNHTAEPLYSLLRKALKEARGRASREAAERDSGHPGPGPPSHMTTSSHSSCSGRGSSSFVLGLGRNRRTVRNSRGERRWRRRFLTPRPTMQVEWTLATSSRRFGGFGTGSLITTTF